LFSTDWFLGWYLDRRIEVNPTVTGAAWGGTISAFVDTSDHYALVKVHDHYLQYNKAKSFNLQTEDGADKLVVVKIDDKTVFHETLLQAKLDSLSSNSKYMYTFNARVYAIEVCKQYVSGSVDLMDISIYDVTAGQSKDCKGTVGTSREAPVTVTKPPRSGFCFSGLTKVQVKDKGAILMQDVQIGDEVMVAKNTYDTVYSFGHRHELVEAEFLQLLPTALEITKDHMVFVEGGHSVPASSIQVGDRLQLGTGLLVTVTAIETVMRTGVYAPFTFSGTVVVSDVLASNYVAFQDSSDPRLVVGTWKTPLQFHWLAHASQAPHRIFARVFGTMVDERYTIHGTSTWVDAPYIFAQWFFRQHPFVMVLLLFPMLAFFLVFFIMDLVSSAFV
jgi:hypothetical protein